MSGGLYEETREPDAVLYIPGGKLHSCWNSNNVCRSFILPILRNRYYPEPLDTVDSRHLIGPAQRPLSRNLPQANAAIIHRLLNYPSGL